jgi:hypothetical protein
MRQLVKNCPTNSDQMYLEAPATLVKIRLTLVKKTQARQARESR